MILEVCFLVTDVNGSTIIGLANNREDALDMVLRHAHANNLTKEKESFEAMRQWFSVYGGEDSHGHECFFPLHTDIRQRATVKITTLVVNNKSCPVPFVIG